MDKTFTHAVARLLGGTHTFRELPIGSAFRFPTNAKGELCRKAGPNVYLYGSHHYRVDVNKAVVLVSE